jgi:hypothetical protein
MAVAMAEGHPRLREHRLRRALRFSPRALCHGEAAMVRKMPRHRERTLAKRRMGDG